MEQIQKLITRVINGDTQRLRDLSGNIPAGVLYGVQLFEERTKYAGCDAGYIHHGTHASATA